MTSLVEKILNKDYLTAKTIFDQRINEIVEMKLLEAKKMVAAKIDSKKSSKNKEPTKEYGVDYERKLAKKEQPDKAKYMEENFLRLLRYARPLGKEFKDFMKSKGVNPRNPEASGVSSKTADYIENMFKGKYRQPNVDIPNKANEIMPQIVKPKPTLVKPEPQPVKPDVKPLELTPKPDVKVPDPNVEKINTITQKIKDWAGPDPVDRIKDATEKIKNLMPKDVQENVKMPKAKQIKKMKFPGATKVRPTFSDNKAAAYRKVMQALRKLKKVKLEEEITEKTPLKSVIHDFVHSDNPKFAGKTKKQRIQQALGAYYGMHNEMHYNKWNQKQLDIESGKRLDSQARRNLVPTLTAKMEKDKSIPNSLASYKDKIYRARMAELRKK